MSTGTNTVTRIGYSVESVIEPEVADGLMLSQKSKLRLGALCGCAYADRSVV